VLTLKALIKSGNSNCAPSSRPDFYRFMQQNSTTLERDSSDTTIYSTS